MNIFQYLEEGEVIDNACLLAAKCLIENNLHVIPLDRASASKSPSKEIKTVSLLREHPISLGNYEYFFNRDNIDIGMMLSRSMEVIDIDEKHYKGITTRILSAIELGWPELHEKLCISRTPSGGAHILYYSEIVGGDPVLAKKHDNPNPTAFVERIDETNKNYIKIAPSPGYHFIQKSPLELPFLTAEERGWLIAVCRSFNEVVIPEVKKPDAKRDDSPWNVFNKAKDWTYIISELQDRGWEAIREFPDRVVINRPGSSQAHSGTIWKESARMYLFTTASEFEPAKAYSPFGIYCHFYHDGNVFMASRALAGEGYGKDITEEGQFWKKEGKRVVVKYTELLAWATAIGYRKYENEIVQVIDKKVRIVNPSDLKIAFLKEVEPIMVDHFYERVSTIFADNGGLIAMLPRLEYEFLTDTKDTTWLFFENCAVKITIAGHQQVLYNQLEGIIWEKSILPRRFYASDYEGFDIHRFIHILGGEHYQKLEQMIGYSLSRYKDPLITKAVVLMEDIDADNEGESQGRSGKGLVFQIVAQFRNSCRMNGKGFSFHDAFLWQNVEHDTDIIFIDDVEKNFPFSKLYSVITEGLMVNKKGVKQVFIPYSRSPKLFVTSNFAVGNMDDSTRDRKYEFPVVKHFSSRHKPIDEFGRPFFNGWTEQDWNKFDSYIIHCISSFMAIPDQDISVTTENSADRSLIHDTSKEFVEFMDDQMESNFFLFASPLVKNATITENGMTTTNAVNVLQFLSHQHDPDYYCRINKKDFLDKVVEVTKYRGLGMSTLSRWLQKWADTRGVRIDITYKRIATDPRQYRFIWWPKLDSEDLSKFRDEF
jgi:hypothetical protein